MGGRENKVSEIERWGDINVIKKVAAASHFGQINILMWADKWCLRGAGQLALLT